MKFRTRAAVRPAASTRQQASLSSFRTVVLKFALLLLGLVIALAVAEVGLMVFFRGHFVTFEDERTLLYRYDRTLGWFPIANSKDQFLASRIITVENNSEGFRAPERRPGDKPGIIFLGDSFVWGYDVDAPERFTDKLQARHPEWSIFNFGVSGYGTDQEYLLLQQYFDAYRPRVVLLMYCTETDEEDNRSNVSHVDYYKPYFTLTRGGELELQGVPVPRSQRSFLSGHPLMARFYVVQLVVRGWFKLTAPRPVVNPDPTGAIIRDLQKYVASKGATLVIGLTRPNPPLEEFLRYLRLPYVDLSTPLRYSSFGNHWTPEGHTFVCDKIEEFFATGKFMESREKAEAPAVQSTPTH
jgi:hypothetical protein